MVAQHKKPPGQPPRRPAHLVTTTPIPPLPGSPSPLPASPGHRHAPQHDHHLPVRSDPHGPPHPRPTLRVRLLDALAGEPELVLRGHFQNVSTLEHGLEPRNERVATLTPGDGGSFTGSFTAPESAAYGTLVVEDVAGERLDTNGGMHFELLIHGEQDRSSLADVLFQRANHYDDRDPAIASESRRRGAELLRTVLAEEHSGEPVTVTISDSPVSGEDFELPLELRWTRAWLRWQEDGNSRLALEELEDEWPVAEGLRTGIANSGLLLAVELRDLDAVDRWAERILREGWTDPWSDKVMIAQMISTVPERRARARELARSALADLDAVDLAGYPGRPLGQTASEYAAVIARARADALVELNRLRLVPAR